MERIRLWTDGCCLHEGDDRKISIGGWAYVVERRGEILAEDSGGAQRTNAARMELAAVVQALLFDAGRSSVEVVTDSHHVFHFATTGRRGMPAWQRNADLWEELARLRSGREVRFSLVKGHRHAFNMEADILSRFAARRFRVVRRRLIAASRT